MDQYNNHHHNQQQQQQSDQYLKLFSSILPVSPLNTDAFLGQYNQALAQDLDLDGYGLVNDTTIDHGNITNADLDMRDVFIPPNQQNQQQQQQRHQQQYYNNHQSDNSMIQSERGGGVGASTTSRIDDSVLYRGGGGGGGGVGQSSRMNPINHSSTTVIPQSSVIYQPTQRPTTSTTSNNDNDTSHYIPSYPEASRPSVSEYRGYQDQVSRVQNHQHQIQQQQQQQQQHQYNQHQLSRSMGSDFNNTVIYNQPPHAATTTTGVAMVPNTNSTVFSATASTKHDHRLQGEFDNPLDFDPSISVNSLDTGKTNFNIDNNAFYGNYQQQPQNHHQQLPKFVYGNIPTNSIVSNYPDDSLIYTPDTFDPNASTTPPLPHPTSSSSSQGQYYQRPTTQQQQQQQQPIQYIDQLTPSTLFGEKSEALGTLSGNGAPPKFEDSLVNPSPGASMINGNNVSATSNMNSPFVTGYQIDQHHQNQQHQQQQQQSNESFGVGPNYSRNTVLQYTPKSTDLERSNYQHLMEKYRGLVLMDDTTMSRDISSLNITNTNQPINHNNNGGSNQSRTASFNVSNLSQQQQPTIVNTASIHHYQQPQPQPHQSLQQSQQSRSQNNNNNFNNSNNGYTMIQPHPSSSSSSSPLRNNNQNNNEQDYSYPGELRIEKVLDFGPCDKDWMITRDLVINNPNDYPISILSFSIHGPSRDCFKVLNTNMIDVPTLLEIKPYSRLTLGLEYAPTLPTRQEKDISSATLQIFCSSTQQQQQVSTNYSVSLYGACIHSRPTQKPPTNLHNYNIYDLGICSPGQTLESRLLNNHNGHPLQIQSIGEGFSCQELPNHQVLLRYTPPKSLKAEGQVIIVDTVTRQKKIVKLTATINQPSLNDQQYQYTQSQPTHPNQQSQPQPQPIIHFDRKDVQGQDLKIGLPKEVYKNGGIEFQPNETIYQLPLKYFGESRIRIDIISINTQLYHISPTQFTLDSNNDSITLVIRYIGKITSPPPFSTFIISSPNSNDAIKININHDKDGDEDEQEDQEEQEEEKGIGKSQRRNGGLFNGQGQDDFEPSDASTPSPNSSPNINSTNQQPLSVIFQDENNKKQDLQQQSEKLMLYCSKRIVSFGGVRLGENKYQLIKLSSNSKKALHINVGLVKHDNQIHLNADSMIIAPGSSSDLMVQYSPLQATTHSNILHVQMHDGSWFNIPIRSYGGRAMMRVLSPCSIDHMGRSVVHVTTKLPYTDQGVGYHTVLSVKNEGQRPGFIRAISSFTNGNIKIQPDSAVIGIGKTLEFKVTITPDLSSSIVALDPLMSQKGTIKFYYGDEIARKRRRAAKHLVGLPDTTPLKGQSNYQSFQIFDQDFLYEHLFNESENEQNDDEEDENNNNSIINDQSFNQMEMELFDENISSIILIPYVGAMEQLKTPAPAPQPQFSAPSTSATPSTIGRKLDTTLQQPPPSTNTNTPSTISTMNNSTMNTSAVTNNTPYQIPSRSTMNRQHQQSQSQPLQQSQHQHLQQHLQQTQPLQQSTQYTIPQTPLPTELNTKDLQKGDSTVVRMNHISTSTPPVTVIKQNQQQQQQVPPSILKETQPTNFNHFNPSIFGSAAKKYDFGLSSVHPPQSILKQSQQQQGGASQYQDEPSQLFANSFFNTSRPIDDDEQVNQQEEEEIRGGQEDIHEYSNVQEDDSRLFETQIRDHEYDDLFIDEANQSLQQHQHQQSVYTDDEQEEEEEDFNNGMGDGSLGLSPSSSLISTPTTSPKSIQQQQHLFSTTTRTPGLASMMHTSAIKHRPPQQHHQQQHSSTSTRPTPFNQALFRSTNPITSTTSTSSTATPPSTTTGNRLFRSEYQLPQPMIPEEPQQEEQEEETILFPQEPSVAFGNVALNERSATKIGVSNASNEPLEVMLSPLVAPFDTNYQHVTLKPQCTTRIPVYFSPTSQGEHIQYITISTIPSSQNDQILNCTIQLKGQCQ
ncbi:hypothetical protein DFA_07003 [Cavenderia fasciculata]|uniref:Uncharacterized protein n=1 Tax=Cavenderia fasciculata TaxID=261658 RepID=F4PX96_CACFS|nr:uncharacterized protein DFA_07003 [Cavenderia fasciculata]EGG19899.1 hypothetical protein DFA_07003 [Cavenderia fasciculata]|eukprot:XP_004366882.1 hypothetical protein DFA_07003 [Cavenderia fasciculata]